MCMPLTRCQREWLWDRRRQWAIILRRYEMQRAATRQGTTKESP